jgi:hypothetical protein
MKRTALSALMTVLVCQPVVGAESLTEAITSGTVKADIRIRYEDVGNDNTDSDGMTIRTRLGYMTGTYSDFSAYVEFEDVRDMFGIDDKEGLIPDPETTELDQGFLQYKNDQVTGKAGRQVITLDNQRFVGDVGWRQDRQTFDAARAQFMPMDNLSVDLSYLWKRNRIFAETADADSDDLLINVGYVTPIGKLIGYGYLLDDQTRDEESDTLGVRLTGKSGMFSYTLEVASQEITDSGIDYDTDYLFAEGGLALSGVTLKLGYELLGSDGGDASFTTPIATLHKFNGWADIFLGGTFDPAVMPDGLVDNYISASGKLADYRLTSVFHDFSADEGSSDYGSEIDLQVSRKFGKHYNAGVKYAAYSDDGFNADGDVEKLWVWGSMSF